jgi:hypothetical protein
MDRRRRRTTSFGRSGPNRRHVQADVVEHRLAEALGHGADERRPLRWWQALQVRLEDDGREESLERLTGLEPRRLRLQPTANVAEAGGEQARLGRLRGLVMGRARPPVADGPDGGPDPLDVPRAAELRDEASARNDDRSEVSKERIVIRDPVERRRGDDRVDRRLDRERIAEVGDEVRDAIAEVPQPSAARLDHRRRGIQCDDRPVREPVGECLRDAPAAAAGVEDALRAPEGKPLEDGTTPPLLRRGDGVVGGSVPVTDHLSSIPPHRIEAGSRC